MVDATRSGVRVAFEGDLDIAGSALARDVLQSVQRHVMHVTLDLSRVGAIDSAGLGVLVAGFRRAAASGGSLTVSRSSVAIDHALRVMGLTGMAASGAPDA